MALVSFSCAQCGKIAQQEAGAVNRSRKNGNRLFCNRRCAGLARRAHKTKAQKVAEKAAYDAEYRRKNIKFLKASKALHFKQTYDPVQAAIYRKARMPKHVEYCRRPEYRAWKKAYDKKYKAQKDYGPFAEVAMLTVDLNHEVKQRMTNHEIKWQNQTCNKTQFRRREDNQEQSRGRPRHRNRHKAAHSQ